MEKTIIRKNDYKDSVVLMLLTNEIATLDGVNKVSIMMATPANKDILRQSDLLTHEAESASADDIAIVMDVNDEDTVQTVLEHIEDFLTQSNQRSGSDVKETVRSWKQLDQYDQDLNLAVISVPGMYAAAEADKALNRNMNVFIFSDNVSIDDEIKLKQKAHQKGLLVMGPDCGTGIINGVPIAFTNHVNTGNIGVVGASGTGIQELTSLISELGEGISSAIGTGGRDLKKDIGAITMLDSIRHIAQDTNTKVLVIISKPPHPFVKMKVEELLATLDLPIVSLFLGEKPKDHAANHYRAYTLEEAAKAAVAFARHENPFALDMNQQQDIQPELKGTKIHGYYSGGTLASEASMLIRDALHLNDKHTDQEGVMLQADGHRIIDLGDDKYTQGKPHPMIDPSARIEMMRNASEDPNVGVILFDIVLGYGSHEDMAGALAPTIYELYQKTILDGRNLKFVATICGTKLDIQNKDEQVRILEDLGVLVTSSNALAVDIALRLIGSSINYDKLPILEQDKGLIDKDQIHESIMNLITTKPKILNVGLSSFYDNLSNFDVEALQYDWKPIAGGKPELVEALDFLNTYEFTGKEYNHV